MLLDCRSLEYRQVAIPENLCILVTDTGVKHSLAGGEYNRRRAECDAAVQVLVEPGVQVEVRPAQPRPDNDANNDAAKARAAEVKKRQAAQQEAMAARYRAQLVARRGQRLDQ